MKPSCYWILLLISIFSFSEISAQTLAFPTAEGYGKYATGGRGGQVVEVTTVEDDGVGNIPGSLRWALKQYPGQPLTVVFRVSGIIDLNGKDLRSKRNNITIAGQTAPGDGICIKGQSVNFGGSYNLIIRNLRFRTGSYTTSGAAVNAACFILENGGNFIIDHCSFSWSSEELCNISDDDDWTTQWCIFSEGLYNSVNGKGARGYGPVFAGLGASFHHNLLSSNVSRSPRFGVTSDVNRVITVDYVNNINYNYGGSRACYGGENRKGKWGTATINMVNNYYKQGPAYPNDRTSQFVRASYWKQAQDTFFTKWHLSGNYIEGETNKKLNSNNYSGLEISEYTDNVPGCTLADLIAPQYVTTAPIQIESAQDAYNSVLAKSGALPLDTIDRRIINEATTGLSTAVSSWNARRVSGIIDTPEDVEGWPEYHTYNTITDNDHDGMDDAWELANGLDPTNPYDRNKLTASGYTALEVYLNSLMGETIELDFNTGIESFESGPEISFIKIGHLITIESMYGIQQFSLYDISGREMNMGGAIESNTIDISSLSQGVYILAAVSNKLKKHYYKFSTK